MNAQTKHTPGPWVASKNDAQEWRIDAPNGDPNICHGSWTELATVYGCDDSPKKGAMVAQSNARLIAAAPELLGLLQELIDIEGPQPGTAEWASKVRAAIANATGEQP